MPKTDAVWAQDAERALKEASDPASYYAARAEEYRLAGRPATAADMLDEALKAAPDRADLLTRRGAMRLDAALIRGGGRAAEGDEDIAAARKDADAAAKSAEDAKDADLTAAARYLLGRIDEALGKFGAAADEYGSALDALRRRPRRRRVPPHGGAGPAR